MADWKKHLYVADSGIHGKGLFAKKDIPKGTELGICKTRKSKEAGLHTLTFDDGSMRDVTCKLRYINHSKRPNVSYYDDLSVVALKKIKVDEELLHDYGDEWDEHGPIED